MKGSEQVSVWVLECDLGQSTTLMHQVVVLNSEGTLESREVGIEKPLGVQQWETPSPALGKD